ncbi:RNA 3'-terminal phosphate cyclase, partial [Kipferlia bialata]|eukprot:g11958.t1
MSGEPIDLDGGFGEGGGAILRVGVGLGAALHRRVSVKDIRANRPKPGLRAQHCTGINGIADLVGGTVRPQLE